MLTLEQLILALPDDSKEKVLRLVEEAHASLMGDETLEVSSLYNAMKIEIKKLIAL